MRRAVERRAHHRQVEHGDRGERVDLGVSSRLMLRDQSIDDVLEIVAALRRRAGALRRSP